MNCLVTRVHVKQNACLNIKKNDNLWSKITEHVLSCIILLQRTVIIKNTALKEWETLNTQYTSVIKNPKIKLIVLTGTI